MQCDAGLDITTGHYKRMMRDLPISVPGGWGGGGTPIYGLYRYVPRDRVWILRFSVLK